MGYASKAQLKTLAENIKAKFAKKIDPDAISGNAQQLVASVGVTDKVPYNFRTAGGSADIGNRLNDKLVGGTIAWNQRQDDLPELTLGGVTRTKIENGWYHFEGTSLSQAVFATAYPTPNHVTLVDYDYRVAEETYRMTFRHDNVGVINSSRIVKVPTSLAFYMYVDASGRIIDIDAKFMLIDLTQMFGSTIADYIYSLEQATAGAGVAWFKKLFPKPYYEYNAGELMSVCTNEHITRGFNAWDEEWENGGYDTTNGQKQDLSQYIRCKNKIEVVPNATYWFRLPPDYASWVNVLYYDANQEYIGFLESGLYGPAAQSGLANYHNPFTTPNGCRYITFFCGDQYGTTYNHDICINLSWSGYRNGEYEPYVEHHYPLSPVELRGILKLDSANNLYYDGDIYEKDGTVTRKWAKRKLKDLNWIYVAAYDVFYADSQTHSVRFTPNVLCNVYTTETTYFTAIGNKTIGFVGENDSVLWLKDTDYTNADDLKNHFTDNDSVIFELATPTTETTNPFTDPQIVDDFGTEEYVDALATAETNPRDVEVPVGHETFYQANLRDKLQNLQANASADGLYLVKQTGNKQELITYTPEAELPTVQTEGTYALKSVDGVLTWVLES